MGQGHVSKYGSALIAAASLCAAASAQGVVYREHWSYLHLENRRLEVLRQLSERSASDVDAVASAFAAPDLGEPWRRAAEVMARLRGVAVDDAFVLRAAMCAFVLPEVADPEAANAECRVTNVSTFLPTALPLPPGLAIEVVVHDGKGALMWSGPVAGELTIENLRMGRPVARIPAERLADGSYFLTVRTRVEGRDPGAADPVLRWPMHVVRGFQTRCEQAMARAAEVAPRLAALPRALLAGLARPVRHAYAGEAFEGTSRAPIDLDRLERALRNVAEQKHVLDGMSGDVPVQVADQGLACVVRLTAPFTAGGRSARPLVLFAAASPAYGADANRPVAPATRGPAWLAMELPDVGAGGQYDVVFVESPGGGRDYARALVATIAGCKELLATAGAPVLLVCDRESASVAALYVERLRPLATALVLVGAGGMSGTALDGLGALSVRLAPVTGHKGSDGLRRTLDYVRTRRAAGDWHGDLARLSDAEPPWLFAVPLLAPTIESFAREHFAR